MCCLQHARRRQKRVQQTGTEQRRQVEQAAAKSKQGERQKYKLHQPRNLDTLCLRICVTSKHQPDGTEGVKRGEEGGKQADSVERTVEQAALLPDSGKDTV